VPFALLTLFAAVTYLLYGSSLNNWWCCDDAQILWHAVQYSANEYFFVPEAWRSLSPNNFTPWLTLSYDIDYVLFGFAPKGFYAHNLVVIGMCAGLIYLIARQWVDDWYAAVGAVLFLAGTPVATASQLLMERHYLEGLLFYLLALMMFTQGMRKTQTRYGGLAGIAFAIAASAKEIYLPLGFLPFLLPLHSFRQRLNMAWPFLLVMLLYVPWRWFMLGEAIGGYAPAAELAQGGFVSLLAEFTKIPKLLWNPPGIGLGTLWLVAMIVLVRGRARGRMVLLLVAVLLLLLLPLIPLARYPGLKSGTERYLVAVWAILALGVSVMLGQAARDRPWWNRWVLLIVVAAVMIPALNQSRSVLDGLAFLHAEYRAHGMALASQSAQEVIFATPGIVPWYSKGMITLRPAMGTMEQAPSVVADESELVGLDMRGRRVLRYNPTSRTMEDITGNIADMLTQWRKTLLSIPLTVAIEYSDESQIVHWKLGPSEAGRYTFLPVGEGGQIPIPSQGALRIGKPLSGWFRYRYDAPDGRIAYTALLSLASHHGDGIARLSWQGTSDLFLPAVKDSTGSTYTGQALSRRTSGAQ
jgi:hypothetical protein